MYKINKFEGEIYQKLNKILDSYNQEQNSVINLAACISYPFTEVLEIQSFPLATLPTEGAVENAFFLIVLHWIILKYIQKNCVFNFLI